MRQPLRRRDFTLRQNRVIYVLMVVTALLALSYSVWRYMQ